MEYWSNVLGFHPPLQYSITPLLQQAKQITV